MMNAITQSRCKAYPGGAVVCSQVGGLACAYRLWRGWGGNFGAGTLTLSEGMELASSTSNRNASIAEDVAVVGGDWAGEAVSEGRAQCLHGVVEIVVGNTAGAQRLVGPVSAASTELLEGLHVVLVLAQLWGDASKDVLVHIQDLDRTRHQWESAFKQIIPQEHDGQAVKFSERRNVPRWKSFLVWRTI
jgi:hypothetical protein